MVCEMMRTYHLFVIRKEYYDLYNDNSALLYKALSSLFKVKLNNYSFGLSIYKQLCEPIEISYLSDYLNYRFRLKKNRHKYLVVNDARKETSLIFLKPSHITVYTNVNFPHVLNLFYLYQRRIFVVDIENQDYFWIKDYKKPMF